MFITHCNFPENFTITAHSGCEQTPPNSLDSLKMAESLNCDIAEVDVRFTFDGIPVMTHDRNFTDVTTLEEAFILVSGFEKLKLNLDIKETSHLCNIIPLAEKYSMTDRIFCTGIFEKDTAEIKKQFPGCTYYLNMDIRPSWRQNNAYFEKLCSTIKENGAVGLNCHHRNVTKRLVSYLHRNGILVSLWTVDKKKDMKRVISLCPDNITTRYPSELKKMISEICD